MGFRGTELLLTIEKRGMSLIGTFGLILKNK